MLKRVADACGVRQKVKVLLVDDHVAMLSLIPETLERSVPGRYEVQCLSTVEEALTALTEHTYDVCLMDYDLKEVQTGIDVIKACYSLGVELPFIVITGLPQEELIIKQALEQPNCMGFLSKDSLKLLDEMIQFAVRNFALLCIERRKGTGTEVQLCWQGVARAGVLHCSFVERHRMEMV